MKKNRSQRPPETLADLAGALKFAQYIAWRATTGIDRDADAHLKPPFAEFMRTKFDERCKAEGTSHEEIATLLAENEEWLAEIKNRTAEMN